MLDSRIIWARRWDRLWSLWLLAVFVVLPLTAWLQHIHSTAVAGRWILMVLGALVFPVGMLHGVAIWLGFGP